MSAPTIRRPSHLAPSAATHPLTALLRAAARRALPPVDGTVAACPAPSGRAPWPSPSAGSRWWPRTSPRVGERARPRGAGGAVAPPFLAALAERLGVPTPGVDVLLVARKPPQAGPRAALVPSDRVDAAWAADRTDVTSWAAADGAGVIMIGRGPGGRLDLRVELEGSDRLADRGHRGARPRPPGSRAHPGRRRPVRLGARLRRDRAADLPLRGLPGGRGRGPVPHPYMVLLIPARTPRRPPWSHGPNRGGFP